MSLFCLLLPKYSPLALPFFSAPSCRMHKYKQKNLMNTQYQCIEESGQDWHWISISFCLPSSNTIESKSNIVNVHTDTVVCLMVWRTSIVLSIHPKPANISHHRICWVHQRRPFSTQSTIFWMKVSGFGWPIWSRSKLKCLWHCCVLLFLPGPPLDFVFVSWMENICVRKRSRGSDNGALLYTLQLQNGFSKCLMRPTSFRMHGT